MEKDKEFVIGTRNKKGLIRKVKWLPDRVVVSREEHREYLKLKEDIEILKTKIGEYMEITDLQDIIKDFKYTGKDGIILNQKKEILELIKSVMGLTGKNIKLKEEIGLLKTLIESGDIVQKEERKFRKEQMNEQKEEIKRLKIEIEEIEKARAFTCDIPKSWLIENGKTIDPDDPNYDKFKELYDKINEESTSKERLTKLDDIETKEFLDGEL